VKAVAQRAYGPAHARLELVDVATPAIGDTDVLVRVRATSVNPADWHLMRGEPYIARLQLGLRTPKTAILGCDVAGRIDAVGANVTSLRPGDEVFASPFSRGFGAFAEYVRVPADLVVAKPANLSFEHAAAVPLAATTALQGLRDHGRVQAGQHVLIIGASGGVGTFAVQIAKALGAEVTGVCSTRNAEMVRSLGADHIVDYTHEDFVDGDRRYDLILQVAGMRSPWECRRALTPTGTLVLISGDSRDRWVGALGRIVAGLAMSPFLTQRIVAFTAKPSGLDLRVLKELIEAGKLTPVIDRTYSLSEVPDAIAYLEEGHARGKVVITVE
jgi:NADPH:quinone reductase-like Zn-dependent oxidoreductase